MLHLRLCTVFLILANCSFSSLAQVNLDRYYDQTSIPFLNRYAPQSIDYKWKVDTRSQILLNEGLTYLDKGDPLMALGKFDTFLNSNNTDWAGHFYRGQALILLGRFKEAVKEFETVIRIDRTVTAAYVELGASWEAQKEFRKAYQKFTTATEINPHYTYAYYKMACMDILLKDINEAKKLFEKCNKLNPNFPDAYMVQGIIVIQGGKNNKSYADAIPFFNAALKADSTFAPAYFWRGLSYAQSNSDQNDKCLADLDHFLQFRPFNSFVRVLRGFLKVEMGDIDGAFSDFRKVLSLSATDEDRFQGTQTIFDKRTDLRYAANYLITQGYGMKEEVFFSIKAGFCLLLMGRESEAMVHLSKAELLGNASSSLYLLMAIAYEHGKSPEQAFEYYNKALELDNDILDAHKKRSIHLADVGRWSEAYRDIDEILRIQPGSLVAYKIRGLVESKQGKYVEAIKDLTYFLNSDSLDIDALRTRAQCNSSVNNLEAANLDIVRLLKLLPPVEEVYVDLANEYIARKDTINLVCILKQYPSSFRKPALMVELINILILKGKYDEALEKIDVLKVFIKGNQQSLLYDNGYIAKLGITILDLEGEALFHMKRYAEAVKSLTKVLETNPEKEEPRYLRAQCYLQLKNIKKAKEDLLPLKKSKYKDSQRLYALTEQ